MALTKWNQVKKSTKSNFITFSIVIGFYIVVQLLAAAGVLTNSFSGQLVPICAYVVMALSLNLTVGILGELSLGHAGFMSIGAYTAADWAAQYKSLLDLVREKQPDAVIFIQSIFHTTQKKSDSSYFKNEVINERNAAIAQLADGKTIFYLDLNPLFDDENGALRADYSGDGVHVRAPYYVQWRDELYRFGVVK